MPEFKLSYTGNQINERLSRIDSLAEKSELPTKTSDLINDSNFTTKDYIQDFAQPKGDYLKSTALSTAVNEALAQAKASGEFDGADGQPGSAGYTPVRGVDYYTEADKAEMVSSVISALPKYNGEVVAV